FDTVYLGIDTGSDLTWTQCEGCRKCFYQVDPYFSPSRSISYKLFPCQQCPSPCQHEDICRLTRNYGDGSRLRADAATETFHFQSVDNKFVYVNDVFFGCGTFMINFNEEHIQGNKVSGLLGMGYGNASFWKQKYQVSQGRFSYCLQSPVTATEGKQPMYLRFGDDIIEPPQMKSTPLHQFKDHPQYYLTLEGISVGNQRLPVDPAVYKIKPDGSGGCIIDSGSYMSYVVSEAYNELVKAVSLNIEKFNRNLRKIPDPKLGKRLCYERFQDPVKVFLPVIVFHFSYNADFAMQPHAAYAFENTKSGNGLVCMMILESTRTDHYGVTYLGAHQQSNHRIVFDLNNGQLRFGPVNCAESN
ncbi:Aspartic proteinase nepenthesin-1, partial [Bienertia sinuspersici]